MGKTKKARGRLMLNCLIVSSILWVSTMAFRTYHFTRRSLHFRGKVTHHGVASTPGYRKAIVIEYVPPKGRLWTGDNFLLLFRGRYRVWELRATRCYTVDTLQEARELLKSGKRAQNTPCKP